MPVKSIPDVDGFIEQIADILRRPDVAGISEGAIPEEYPPTGVHRWACVRASFPAASQPDPEVVRHLVGELRHQIASRCSSADQCLVLPIPRSRSVSGRIVLIDGFPVRLMGSYHYLDDDLLVTLDVGIRD
jgi:hypothetical protein